MKRYRRHIRTGSPAATAALNARVEALVPKETVHALMGDGFGRVSPYLYEELKAKFSQPVMDTSVGVLSAIAGIRIEIDCTLPFVQRLTPRVLRSRRWKARVAERRRAAKRKDLDDSLALIANLMLPRARPFPTHPVIAPSFGSDVYRPFMGGLS